MTIRTYQDAVAFVTGGASGIGKAITRSLVAQGATVVIADRQDDIVHQVADELGGKAKRVQGVVLDVRDAGAVAQAIEGVFATHGRLDYLFNNAGTGTAGEAQDLTLDDWKYVVDVNLMGVIHGVHAAYPRMMKQGFGHIVNTASTAGLTPTPFIIPYVATKHAVVGLSRSLRLEGRAYGVHVSALCPGVIRTPLLDNGGRYGRTKVDVPPDQQKVLWQKLRPMDADVFAARVLRDVARNVPVIIHPRSWRVLFWFDKLFPGISERTGVWLYQRARAELYGAAANNDKVPL